VNIEETTKMLAKAIRDGDPEAFNRLGRRLRAFSDLCHAAASCEPESRIDLIGQVLGGLNEAAGTFFKDLGVA